MKINKFKFIHEGSKFKAILSEDKCYWLVYDEYKNLSKYFNNKNTENFINTVRRIYKKSCLKLSLPIYGYFLKDATIEYSIKKHGKGFVFAEDYRNNDNMLFCKQDFKNLILEGKFIVISQGVCKDE